VQPDNIHSSRRAVALADVKRCRVILPAVEDAEDGYRVLVNAECDGCAAAESNRP
jgi:hypothetical protein